MPHKSHERTYTPPEGFKGYAVVEPSGAIRLVHDLGTAVEAARHAAKKGLWSVEANVGTGWEAAGPLEQLAPDVYGNPPDYAAFAQRACGLPTYHVDEILGLPLEIAHRQVAAYFNPIRYAVAGRGERGRGRIRKSKSGQVRACQSVAGMIDALFRVNFKLSKSGAKRPGAKKLDPKALGLMLVPEKSVFRGAAGNGTPLPVAYTRTQALAPRPDGLSSTLCLAATEECASSCLAYAGMNVQLHNTIVKLQTTQALLGEPLAFYRVLLAALDRWFMPKDKAWTKSLRFMRLNVLSDLPWERLIPDMFERYPGTRVGGRQLAYYDYTKVPGRRTPHNYDLTFSYSGSEANKRACASEVAAGHRVAVVFLLPGKAVARRTMPLPKVWDGPAGRLPVVDGDLDDFRPLDPKQCYVGLRFKTVAGGQAAEERARKGKFVVKVAAAEVIGGQIVAQQLPRSTPIVTGE